MPEPPRNPPAPADAPVTVDDATLARVAARLAARAADYGAGVDRASLRVDLRPFSSGSTYPLYRADLVTPAGTTALRVVVKFTPVYREHHEGRAEYENLRAMFARVGVSGALRVPRPLDYWEDLAALVTEYAPGERFSSRLFAAAPSSIGELTDTARRCGQWLRTYHEVTARASRSAFDADFVAEVCRDLERLGGSSAAARLRTAAEASLRTLAAHADTLNVRAAIRHGDFSPHNVHVEGESICVFDLSHHAIAPVYDDVCYFLVSLSTMRRPLSRWSFERRVARALEQPFLEGYFGPAAAGARRQDALLLAGHTLKQLLARCVKQRRSAASRGRWAQAAFDRVWIGGVYARRIARVAQSIDGLAREPHTDPAGAPARSALLVGYHFPPAPTPGSQRADALARGLHERGWRVTVLTATADPAGSTDPPGVEVVRTTRRARTRPDGTPAVSRPLPARIPVLKSLTGFPDRYAPWSFALVRLVPRLLSARRPDVVLSSSPPHSSQLAIALVRSLRRFAWVAEFRDPWMFPSRRALNPLSAAVQRGMERFVVGRCDSVLVNTPGNRDALLAACPRLAHARVRVATNGYDAGLFAPETFPGAPTETADFTYVGEVYPGMLERYCDALDAVRTRDARLVPRLAVYGTIDATEQRRIAAHGLDEFVGYRGYVPHADSVDAMKRARALLVLLPAEDRWRTCVPSKVYWYLAARRPIVAIVPEGDTAALVRSAAAGVVLADTDPRVLAVQLMDLVAAQRAHPAPAVEGKGIGRYAMSAIVDGIETALREVTGGNPA